MFFNSSGFSVATDWTQQTFEGEKAQYFQVTREWRGSNMSTLMLISVYILHV